LGAAIQRLPDGDVRRLEGTSLQWRLRVGDWRVIFTMAPSERTILVLLVRPRGAAYKP
jgi:mRNA interferase RelE/StbE